jgi:hypothetical protein
LCGIISYIRRYLNGVIQGSDVAVSTSFVPYGNIKIGKDYNNSDRFWQGSIDDVRIYNRALTAEEVKIQYELIKNKIMNIDDAGKLYIAGRLNEVY